MADARLSSNVPLLNTANVFKPGVDATALFQIQNAQGAPILTLDSVNQVLTVKNAVVSGTLTIGGHIVTNNVAGNTLITAGLAAGSGPTVTLTGNDTSGTITLTTGSGVLSAGILATVSFANAYTTTPHVVISNGNQSTAILQNYTASVSTSGFSINTAIAATGSTTYVYNYFVSQ